MINNHPKSTMSEPISDAAQRMAGNKLSANLTANKPVRNFMRYNTHCAIQCSAKFHEQEAYDCEKIMTFYDFGSRKCPTSFKLIRCGFKVEQRSDRLRISLPLQLN